ncbi:putative serine/threonine-protein kinase/receptor [Phytophthora citrophthora]|uniref:Serine/threonine-protein kinase/receptor n=1 Tax=Phytophthora citrophthora TaxID=4793 RepID=A0AAD9GEM9_9STRA|nr:putative serine/threonine-protein kinase/receptor [Phytophthora citrophthora]
MHQVECSAKTTSSVLREAVSDVFGVLKELEEDASDKLDPSSWQRQADGFWAALKFERLRYSISYTVEELKIIENAALEIAEAISNRRSSPLILPELFLPPYEVDSQVDKKVLGSGAFGSVHENTWLNTPVVIKRVLRSSTRGGKTIPSDGEVIFKHEADIWSSLTHPHVIALFGACHVGQPFFVCEYAAKGTLTDFLEGSEGTTTGRILAWEKLYEAALGLEFPHEHGVIHADLKGDNILIGEDERATLTDFGLSSVASDGASSSGSPIGALRWKAPEICYICFGYFSLGMCIIEALTGVFLWGRELLDAAVSFYVRRGRVPPASSSFTSSQWSQKSSTSEDDPIANEETRNTMHTQLFPAWYAAGKTPEDAYNELKNPSIGDENWPIYKNYKICIVSIVNRRTGMVLEQDLATNTVQAFDFTVNESSHQWFRIPLGGNYFAYKNVATDNLLEHLSLQVGSGDTVAMRDAMDDPKCQWFENKYVYEDMFIGLRNRSSRLFIDHYGSREIQTSADDLRYVEPVETSSDDPSWMIQPNELSCKSEATAEGIYYAKWAFTDVAVKELKLEEDVNRFQTEVKLWSELRHNNIGRFYGANFTTEPYFIVSERVETLDAYVARENPEPIRVYELMFQAAAGLRYLHNHNIVHGDLNGRNIGVNQHGVAVLTGFDLSLRHSESNDQDQGALQQKPTFKGDVFSLGMYVVAAISGTEYPWCNCKYVDFRKCYEARGIPARRPQCMNEDQWELLTTMLVFEADENSELDHVLEVLANFANDDDGRTPKAVMNKESTDIVTVQEEGGVLECNDSASWKKSWEFVQQVPSSPDLS